MITILLAEDQFLLRDALASLLSLEDDLDVVATTGNGSDAYKHALDLQVDICLLDIEMPGLNGLEVAERLKNNTAFSGKVVLLTTFSRPGYIEKAMAAKVDGYLLKDEPIETLTESLRRIAIGEQVISPDLGHILFSLQPNPLGQREIELLKQVKAGLNTEEIAQALHLSEGTVRNYLSSAMQKLGVTTRHEALRIAEENGWI